MASEPRFLCIVPRRVCVCDGSCAMSNPTRICDLARLLGKDTAMTTSDQAAAEAGHVALLEQPFGLLSDLIRFNAQARPHSPALIKDDEVLTYGALDVLMDQIAASLQRDGVQPGEAISICAGSSGAYAATFLGGLRAGVARPRDAPARAGAALSGRGPGCEQDRSWRTCRAPRGTRCVGPAPPGYPAAAATPQRSCGGAGCAAHNDGLLCPMAISLRQITSNFIAGGAYHTGARATFGINHAKQPWGQAERRMNGLLSHSSCPRRTIAA